MQVAKKQRYTASLNKIVKKVRRFFMIIIFSKDHYIVCVCSQCVFFT